MTTREDSALDDGKRDGAVFRVPHDHPCLPGHFPGQPLVPGVVILDRVIDAIERAQGPTYALRLPQVKFVQPLLPDQAATIAIEPLDGGRWRFRVLRDDVLIASGEAVAT